MTVSMCVSSSQEALMCFRSSWLHCWVFRMSWGCLAGRFLLLKLLKTEPNYGIVNTLYKGNVFPMEILLI